MTNLHLKPEYEALLLKTGNPMYACAYFEECSVNACVLDNSLGEKVISPLDPYKDCPLKEHHRKSYIKKYRMSLLKHIQEAHQTPINKTEASEPQEASA